MVMTLPKRDLALVIPSDVIDAIARRTAELSIDAEALTAQARERMTATSQDRLALSRSEAAKALGISIDHLERHVLPDLRIIRTGRLIRIPIAELELWVDTH